MDWHSLVAVAGNALDVFHVCDPVIVTGSVHTIEAVDCAGDPSDPASYSAPLARNKSRWGDVTAILPADCTRTPPDGSVDMMLDCVAIVNKSSNNFCAVLELRADVEPQIPALRINLTYGLQCVDAFSGTTYPYAGQLGSP